MSNLISHTQNGLEAFINQEDGSIWMSLRDCAKLVGQDYSHILAYEKELLFDSIPFKIMEVETPTKIKLVDEEFIFELFVRYNSTLLMECVTFAIIGAGENKSYDQYNTDEVVRFAKRGLHTYLESKIGHLGEKTASPIYMVLEAAANS